MSVEEISILLKQKFNKIELLLHQNCTPKALITSSLNIKEVCEELYKNPSTYFDMLSCITGIDNGSGTNNMEVVYNLYSIPFNHHVMLKVILPRENPEIDSVSEIWRTANWHEREAFEMFGIKFKGHPDFRRLLLPSDWEGHPLKKDYKHQEYYRDVKVEY